MHVISAVDTCRRDGNPVLFQLIIGVSLIVLLSLSVRRAAVRHDFPLNLVLAWSAGIAVLTVGLAFLYRQDFLVDTVGISTSAAATVVSAVLLFTIAFRLSKSHGALDRLARETAISLAIQSFRLEEPVLHPRSNTDALVVIPAYNEQETVSTIIRLLSDFNLECLVVNDGSSDRTSEVAKQAGAHVIDLPINLGIGAALRVGWRVADLLGFAAAVQCDADGQHDPAQINALILSAQNLNVDLLIGSRFTGVESEGQYETSFIRRCAMRVLASHATRVSGVRITDATSGFRCIRQPLLRQFSITYPAEYLESYESLILASKAGWSVGEVPAQMSERLGGTPSHGPVKSALFFFRVLTVRLFGSQISISGPERISN